MLDISDERMVAIGIRPRKFSSNSQRDLYGKVVDIFFKYLTTSEEGFNDNYYDMEPRLFRDIVTDAVHGRRVDVSKVLEDVERTAHLRAGVHFDDVWENRKNPDYDPPWDWEVIERFKSTYGDLSQF